MHLCFYPHFLGNKAPNEEEQLSDSLFTFLEEVANPLCLVFRPFVTSHESFADVPSLLHRYNVNPANKTEMILANACGGLDSVDIFYDEVCENESTNFTGFLDFNRNLVTANNARCIWKYKTIIVVGRNGLSGTIMDIPTYMFPFTYYPFLVDYNLFDEAPPSYEMETLHHLVRACKNCQKTKKPCTPLDGMVCTGCVNAKCEPTDAEENFRAQHCYDAATSKAYALSPPYQHLIQSVKTVYCCNRSPKLNAASRRELKQLVQASVIHSTNPAKEQLLYQSCRSAQIVEFINGKMRVVLEKNMEGVFGFSAYEQTRLRKVKVACATPHFGLANFEKAISMVDVAIFRPGELFYIEDSVMYKEQGGYVFRPTRMFIVGGIYSEDRMSFVVGWNY